MTVEIISARIEKGVIYITAVDISEENLQRIERTRDDGNERELELVFDTRDSKARNYIYNWLKNQKKTRTCTTWGEAIRAVVGIITDIGVYYRSWE